MALHLRTLGALASLLLVATGFAVVIEPPAACDGASAATCAGGGEAARADDDEESLLALGRARRSTGAHGVAAPEGVDSSYRRPKFHATSPMREFKPNLKCPSPPCSDQVHIQLGGPGEMVISWASTPTADTPSQVKWWEKGPGASSMEQLTNGTAESYSLLMSWDSELWDPTMGVNEVYPEKVAQMQSTDRWAYDDATGWQFPGLYRKVDPDDLHTGLGMYKNPGEQYHSPQLHTVVLRNLEPGRKYKYQVANDDRVFTFTMPVETETYPFTAGLMSDVGQTAVSAMSFRVMRKRIRPDVVLYSGDLSYADGYGPRWDTYGRLYEKIGTRVPTMYCPGNHEQSSGEAYVPYKKRYPMSFAAAASGSGDANYWSRNIGPMHVISLNSYAGYTKDSSQYVWLAKDLAAFDRKATPWLVVLMHVPFYNSNAGHIGEAKLMREAMEDMLYHYGVNLVINGHVHSYERTFKMYRNSTEEACGITYLNVGDGGNREGPYLEWLPGKVGRKRPDWSAFREGSFGVGRLVLHNETHAYFDWQRHACWDNTEDAPPNKISFNPNCTSTGDPSAFATVASDEAWFTRNTLCFNQQ